MPPLYLSPAVFVFVVFVVFVVITIVITIVTSPLSTRSMIKINSE